MRRRQFARTLFVAAAVLSTRAGLEAGVTSHPLYPMSYAMSPPAITVGGDGTPHMLYPSRDDSLRHAWRESGRWRDESVDPRLSSCGPQSITTDSLGRLHVAYTGAFDALLRHGVRDTSGWTFTELAASRGRTSLTMGPGDRPVIAHLGTDDEIEILRFDGIAWHLEETHLEGPMWNNVELECDTGGRIHLSYHRDGLLFHATEDAGVWGETAVSTSPLLLGALTLDPAGNPHLAVSHAGTIPNGQVVHLWNNGSGWQSEEILPPGDPYPNRYVRGAGMDAAGHMFVAYTDSMPIRGENAVFARFAHLDGAKWRSGPRGRRRRAEVGSFSLAADGALHFACARFGLLHIEARLPDPAAEWVAMGTGPSGAGLRADGTLRVRNLGAGRSRPTRVAFYLSDDDLFDEGDQPVGRTRRLDTIGPGRERSFPVTIALPADAAGRRLLAVVDPDARRDDIDRPNNTAAAVVGE